MRRPTVRRPSDTAWTIGAAVGGVAALLAAVLAVVAHALDVAWQPMVIVAAVAHHLVWAAPVAVALFLLARRWRAAVVAGLVLVVAVGTQLPLYVAADAPTHGRAITVLQANLMVGRADPSAVVRAVSGHHVDLLMTEELTSMSRDNLIAAGLAALLPYRFDAALSTGGGGLAIWSRYPLTDERNLPGYRLGVLTATAHLDAHTTVIVAAVHLLPPYPYSSDEWASEIARLRTLLHHEADAGRPVVVGGDFNATPDHAQFRDLLTDGFQDAAERTGAGYLATYPTDRWYPPLIAIDHVLSRDAPAVDISRIALPGSDHRGLLARLRIGR